MGVILRVTVKGACWKQHSCVACGSVFRYLFERSGRASGRVGDDVEGLAQRHLASALHEEIDDCPCPCCGSYQPDMVARHKITWHLTLTVLAVAIGFGIVIPTFAGVLPLDVAGKVAAAVAGFTAVGHLVIALGNPNRHRSRNLRKAQLGLATG